MIANSDDVIVLVPDWISHQNSFRATTAAAHYLQGCTETQPIAISSMPHPCHTLHTKLPSNRVTGVATAGSKICLSQAGQRLHPSSHTSSGGAAAVGVQQHSFGEDKGKHGNNMKQPTIISANKWSFIIFILQYSVARQGTTFYGPLGWWGYWKNYYIRTMNPLHRLDVSFHG